LRQIFKEQSGLDDAQNLLDETSDALKATIDPLPTDITGQYELK